MFLKHFLILLFIAGCVAHNGRGKGKSCKKGSPQKSTTTVVRTEVQRPVNINIDPSIIEKPLSLFGSLFDKFIKPSDKKETQPPNNDRNPNPQTPNRNPNTQTPNRNRNPNTRNDVPDYPDYYEDSPPQTTNTNRKPTKQEVVQKVRDHVTRDKEAIQNKKETLQNNKNTPKSLPEKKQQDDPLQKAHWYRPFTEDDTYDMYDYNEMDDRFK